MAGFDRDVFGGAEAAPPAFDADVFGSSTPSRPIALPGPAPVRGTGSTAIDAANALGTGFWRGATRLAGLPVDTVANVLDLGKAAIGAPYVALTGKAPPRWLEIGDRTRMVGSSDNLLERVRGTSSGRALVDPVNPEFEGGYLQTIGAGASGALMPGTAGQALNRAGIGAASTTAGKAVGDATGSTELAIAASLLPGGAQSLAEAGVKRAIRGGEQGRQEMQSRVTDLDRAGVSNPTLGLASGNKLIGGIENLLQNTPGAIGIMSRAREKALAGMQLTAEEAAVLASATRGALPAGQQIQAGIRDFKDAFKGKQTALYDRLDQSVPGQTPTRAANTSEVLARLNADIPGAPGLSALFKTPRVQAIEEALRADLSPAGTLPYQAIKQTRTLVGNELADGSLLPDVPRSAWRPVYAGLSRDLEAAASNAGPAATQAFSRANDYTRAGMQRLETLRPFADKAAPEQAYTSLVANARENASVLQAVKKSLPEGARGTVAGTVIDRLGRATPGQQNELGDVWSAERFLSNWATMKPEARRELLSGFKNSDQVRTDVEAVARAASLMRENSKLWSNPSGTASSAVARALMLGAPATALVNPWAPVAIGGALGAANLGARFVSSPSTRRFALEGDVRLPLLAPANTMALQGGGLLGLTQPARPSPGGLLDPISLLGMD